MWTVWITVLVAFNRYVAICRPFQAIRVCTMRQARLQVLASALVITVYNVPRFLEHRMQFDDAQVIIARKTPVSPKRYEMTGRISRLELIPADLRLLGGRQTKSK